MPDLAKFNAKEFGALLAKECPCLSFDPKGRPLAGNDPFLPFDQRVWGRLSISSGWYDLVLRTARLIEAEIQRVPEADRKFYYIGLVKEKYAAMQFVTHTPCGPYPGNPTYDAPPREAEPGWNPGVCEAVEQIQKEAHEASLGVCEACGKPGEARGYSWMLTHCDDCYDPEKEAEGAEAWEGCIALDGDRLIGFVEIPD